MRPPEHIGRTGRVPEVVAAQIAEKTGLCHLARGLRAAVKRDDSSARYRLAMFGGGRHVHGRASAVTASALLASRGLLLRDQHRATAELVAFARRGHSVKGDIGVSRDNDDRTVNLAYGPITNTSHRFTVDVGLGRPSDDPASVAMLVSQTNKRAVHDFTLLSERHRDAGRRDAGHQTSREHLSHRMPRICRVALISLLAPDE